MAGVSHDQSSSSCRVYSILTVVCDIMVVGMQIHCRLLHSMHDLKAAQMNMQCDLFCEFVLYKSKMIHNAMEVIRNICCTKDDDAVNHSTITRWFKKFWLWFVVVMPQTILPRRNGRCALSATDTWKPEEEKDARGVTCFMEENMISPREVVRLNAHIRN